jgi:pyruvate formate lyase activating enzyme
MGLRLGLLRLRVAVGAVVIVRIPLIPGVNDDAANIHQIGSYVASLGGVSEIHVLPYHDTARPKYERLGRTFPLAGLARPTPEHVDEVATLLRAHMPAVSIGG